jgi:hypothetical protein
MRGVIIYAYIVHYASNFFQQKKKKKKKNQGKDYGLTEDLQGLGTIN